LAALPPTSEKVLTKYERVHYYKHGSLIKEHQQRCLHYRKGNTAAKSVTLNSQKEKTYGRKLKEACL